MNCDDANALMESYLDSELDTKTTAEIREHISTCLACAQTFASQERFNDQLNSVLRNGFHSAAVWEKAKQGMASPSSANLQSVAAEEPQPARREADTDSWWRFWLWPSPRAYAGLAAVWIAMLALQFTSGQASPGGRLNAKSVPAEIRIALMEQRRWLTELLELPSAPPPSPPSAQPQPRSDRPARKRLI